MLFKGVLNKVPQKSNAWECRGRTQQQTINTEKNNNKKKNNK